MPIRVNDRSKFAVSLSFSYWTMGWHNEERNEYIGNEWYSNTRCLDLLSFSLLLGHRFPLLIFIHP